MRIILFVSRVALICNFFFLLMVLLHFYSFLENEALLSTIVIMGYALSVFVFTPLVVLLYIILFSLHKRVFDFIPKWLVTTNFIFFVLQIAYILFFLNGASNS